MARDQWTTLAENDLEEIVVYLSREHGRDSTARRIYDEIRQRCRLYADNPMLGARYPALGSDYRGFVHKRWLIVYQPRDYGIEVFAVLDSARDFASFFRRRLGMGG